MLTRLLTTADTQAEVAEMRAVDPYEGGVDRERRHRPWLLNVVSMAGCGRSSNRLMYHAEAADVFALRLRND